jgi:hypothetical protein
MKQFCGIGKVDQRKNRERQQESVDAINIQAPPIGKISGGIKKSAQVACDKKEIYRAEITQPFSFEKYYDDIQACQQYEMNVVAPKSEDIHLEILKMELT